MNRLLRLGAMLSPLVLSGSLVAQEPRVGSSFAVIGPVSQPAAEMRGSRFSSEFQLAVRPVLAATLQGMVPAVVANSFGAKPDVPFSPGRQLYGWPERPGLYCDLLRPRGLGLSTACLWDRDLDGRFEEGTRLDFNSGLGDVLAITPSRKIIGVRFTKVRVPLTALVPYVKGAPDPSVTGKISLYFDKAPKKGPPIAQLWLGTPDNYTGTEGLSAEVLAFRTDQLPIDVDLYGLKVRVIGQDEKRALRYSILGVSEGATVPLLFRGYTIRMIGY